MPAPVTRDQELELTIDSLAFGGNGVARLNGFVVFVRRGLPGDTVRARVTKVQRRHAEALATEVLRPSPLRVDAPCLDCGQPVTIEMRDGRITWVDPPEVVGHLNWGFGPSRGKPQFL